MQKKIKDDRLLIKGKHVILRRLKVSDANQRYLRWMRDGEVKQFLESRFETLSLSKLRNYIRRINSDSNFLFFAIIYRVTGEHIGNIKLGPINRSHKFGDLGILIGEKNFWGKGLASEAIKLVADYSFNRLKLHKLTAGAYSNNIGSIKAFKKAGFTVEGRRKSQFKYKGVYIDGMLLGLVSHENIYLD